jgi:hypothetical protein
VTSPALAPTPSETAIAQLESLRRDLDQVVDLADGVDVARRSDALRQWIKVARIRGQAAFQAHELHLRSLRTCGQLLIALVEPEPLGSQNGQPRANLAHLPRHTLSTLGISGQDSSHWQRIARLSDGEFETRLEALRAAGRVPSVASFVRAASQYKRARGGRQTTPTLQRLLHVLALLREIRELRTKREKQLAREVVHLAAGWQKVLRQRHAPTIAERQDVIKRVTSCILCGRTQPPDKPPACPHCRGQWIES